MTIFRENEIDTLRTADLALAAAICVSGFVIEEIERADARRSVFVFKNSPELREAIEKFWRGELLVEPQDYFNQLKALKSRIYGR